ncbi:MAG: hypothetical protein NTV31_05200 [Bacteroidia bacterium]|nr:hypothetical protein [Bacteroidia bacterium]
MKKIFYLLFLMGFIFASSCNYETRKSTQNCCLSSKDSLSIINEIIETTDAYAEANNKIDADRCADFWDSSSDLMFAETGVEYTNWDSLYNDIKKWYSQPLDSVQFIWEERNINPLNHNTAMLYSKAFFRAKFKSGIIYKSKVNLAVLLTKKNEQWKTTIGYWSIKVLEDE